MPDVAAEFIFPEPGKLVTEVGDGLLLHSCQPIHTYHIYWNQTYNNTCYTTFPVTSIKLDTVRFLELSTRRLVKQGHEIPCNKRAPLWYIRDVKNHIWQLNNNNVFQVVKQYSYRYLPNKLRVIKMGTFGRHLLHYDEHIPSRTSLLSLLARNKENLRQLNEFREKGQGNVITGIASLFGQTISSLATGGSQIIKALGEGIHSTLSGVGDVDESLIHSISNATSSLVTSSTNGLAKVLHSIGGISGIVTYVLILLLYVYLIYAKIRENRQLFIPVATTIKPPSPLPPPPPMSPHQQELCQNHQGPTLPPRAT